MRTCTLPPIGRIQDTTRSLRSSRGMADLQHGGMACDHGAPKKATSMLSMSIARMAPLLPREPHVLTRGGGENAPFWTHGIDSVLNGLVMYICITVRAVPEQ